MADRKYVYIATPYSHKSAAVRLKRFKRASRMTGLLMKGENIFAFSPISMCHQISIELASLPDMGFEWQFWADFDGFMIGKCDEFWVYCQPGWEKSVGVNAELKIAKKLGKKIRFVTDTKGLVSPKYKISDEVPTFLCDDPNCYRHHCMVCRQPIDNHDTDCPLT